MIVKSLNSGLRQPRLNTVLCYTMVGRINSPSRTGSDVKTDDATITHNQKCIMFYNSCYKAFSGEEGSSQACLKRLELKELWFLLWSGAVAGVRIPMCGQRFILQPPSLCCQEKAPVLSYWLVQMWSKRGWERFGAWMISAIRTKMGSDS